MKLSFIGLGVMGYPMAGHLQAAGHDVTVYNRTTAKAQNWADQHGGSFAPTPREAAQDCDIVFACVGNDDDLRSVTLGEDGAFASMKAGAIFVDHTTVSKRVTEELAKIAENRGIHYIDAPVSGGQVGAEHAQLSVMCGGDSEIFAKAEPILSIYAKACLLIGPVGSGQLTKMCNQIAIAGLVQALAESLRFSERAGLDSAKVLGAISQGAAGSWQMENRGPTMLEDKFDFGFAVDWIVKDLGICLETAKDIDANLPVTQIVHGFYQELQEMGGNRWDSSALIKRL